jgi:outer membrane protein assembly factor BamB
MSLSIRRCLRLGAVGLIAIAPLFGCSDSNSNGHSQAAVAPPPPPPPPPLPPAQEWLTYAGNAERTYFNARETQINRSNVEQLQVLWTHPTGAIITASPTVAQIELPDGLRMIVYIQSWDGYMYALDLYTGEEIWRYLTKAQEVTFPNTGSAHVGQVNGADAVFFASGERFYALEAATGAELWTFDAGTGCRNSNVECNYRGERNQIESSPIIADGKIFFGMDVDDKERVDSPDPLRAYAGGKGGFYALDANTGFLAWFFDLESGQTCHPEPGDNLSRFDGYHSAAELGLDLIDPDWFNTRRGCNHPRSRNGCGNVWSSAAVDFGRRTLYFAASNCDTEVDDITFRPGPVMPPHDEAITALHFDGSVAWRWRPREVDNADLSFGAVPNLFSIDTTTLPGGEAITVDVVGIGNKDGTYYVMDRDGVNERYTDDVVDHRSPDFPYWRTKVVPGGSFSGIIATAAVDQERDQIYFSSPYQDIANPQRPNVHALDMNTGAILWQRDLSLGSFAPTSAIPGVVFTGSVEGKLFAFDADTGEQIYASDILGSPSISSGVVVNDGIVLVGGGIGARYPVTGAFPDTSTTTSYTPNNVTALCVPGTPSCSK